MSDERETCYTIERDGDTIIIPGEHYDELLEFAANLHRQMCTDKGALVPDGHGLQGLGYVESFEQILRNQENNILLEGYRLKDYYGYHFSRYSMYYKVPLPDFIPEYRRIGRNHQSGQLEFETKFKRCIRAVKVKAPVPAVNKIIEKPAYIDAKNNTQALEVRAIRKWMNKQREANLRNIDFLLSVEDIKELLQATHCHYTGIPIFSYDEATSNQQDDQLTLDRIVNSKGYEKGNVVACSHIANSVKSDGNMESIQGRLKHLQEEIGKTEQNMSLLSEKLVNLKRQEGILVTVVSKLSDRERQSNCVRAEESGSNIADAFPTLVSE